MTEPVDLSVNVDLAVLHALQHGEHRLRLVLDNLPGLLGFLNSDQCYELASRSHYAWFGMHPAAVVGRHVREVIGEEAYRLLRPHYEEALSGENSIFMGEVPYVRGGRRFIHGTAAASRAPDGRVNGIFTLAADLTEHKLIERALDASTLRSQAVLATAVDGIVTIDERGIIQSFTQGAERLFGYTAREAIGHNVSMLMPASHAANHDGYLDRYLRTGERRIIGIGREVTGRRKDGTEFPMELAVGEFVENGRHFFTGFTRDVSDRKKVEQEARQRLNELAHVMRRSSMGDLAAGIAHEINQPLTAIVTMTQAVLRNLRAGRGDAAMLEQTLEKIARQGVRAGAGATFAFRLPLQWQPLE